MELDTLKEAINKIISTTTSLMVKDFFLSYLLVRPPQVKTGTWSVKEAIGKKSCPGNT